MMRTIGQISVIAVAMALMIAFTGIASASWLTALENQTVNTAFGYGKTVTEDQGFDFWRSGRNLPYTNSLSGIADPDGTKSMWLPIIPASYEEANTYSKLLSTDVQATTRANVGMANDPFFNYRMDAGGSNGSMAKGSISAGMSVFAIGGSDPRLSYEERSSASGSWVFHKEMSYTSETKP